MKKITDFIIYGNFFIAVCAAALIWESYLLLKIPVQPIYLATGFVATLFTYNIDRLVVLGSLQNTGNERHNWVVRHHKLMNVISALCLAYLAVSIFFMSWGSLFFLGHLGIISLAYCVPALLKGYRGLRSVKLLKIFLIMYVWAATTVVWPAIGSGIPIFQSNIMLLFLERALFIFAITLPFDIRDYYTDKDTHVITIPGLIGVPNTRLLAFFCLFAFFAINLLHYNFESGILWAKLISGLPSLWVVYKARDNRHEYYFTGLIDGMMLVQFLLVVACSW